MQKVLIVHFNKLVLGYLLKEESDWKFELVIVELTECNVMKVNSINILFMHFNIRSPPSFALTKWE